MREFIAENLLGREEIDFILLLLNNMVALVGAFFLMFTYRITYSGAAYSHKFNVSIGMIVIITNSIMCVISNNVALSLGMVGALSIIRFRSAVKDVRDAAFIFWAIAMGIGCGVSQFALIAVGSLFLFLFMLFTRQIMPDNRKLLVIRGSMDHQNAIEGTVETFFHGAAHQVVKSASGGSYELVYGISAAALRRAGRENASDVIQELMNQEGVTGANLIEQTDDIGR